jgi:hypothetical protein
MLRSLACALCASMLLIACGKKSDEAGTAPNSPATAAPAAAAPAPQIDIKSAAPQRAPKPPSLASGALGEGGGEWRLSKVNVTGAILTVEFDLEGKCCFTEFVPIDQVSYIDDASAKKFSPLRDEGGLWMAAPLNLNKELEFHIAGGITRVWIKFPAPPAESKTISLNLPKIGALDGLPVQR